MTYISNNGSGASQAGPFAAFALPIFKQGYDPVLIAPRDKVPLLKAWTTYTRHMTKDELTMPGMKGDALYLSASQINDWCEQYPNANLGVMTGGARGELTAFDIDSVDTAVVNIVMSVLPQSPVMKFAKKGFTPFFRNDGTVKSRPLIGTDGARLADVLAGGRQTVIPPSIHPEGMLYQWTPGHAALWDVHISALPVLSQAHIDEIVARLLAAGWMPHPKPPMVLVPADIEHVRANLPRYVAVARVKLREKAALLEATPAGGRREAVNGLGYAMGPHVLHGLIEEAEVWHAVLAACEKNGKLAERGGYHDISRELAKALSKGAAKLALPMLRDKTAADAFAGQAPLGQLPALARPFEPGSNVVQMQSYALPPAPAAPRDGMGTVQVQANGVVDVQYSPVPGQDGQFTPRQAAATATAAATWQQPQTGSLTASYVHRQLQSEMEGNALPAFEPELIKRLLPASAGLVAFIAGQSGAGKTFYAVGLSVALASGKPFLGYPVREQVGVIYVAAEGAGTIDGRIYAAKSEYGLSGQQLPIVIIKKCPNLMEPAGRAALIAEVNTRAAEMIQLGLCKRVGLVIIDSLTVAFAMEDEQSNTEATRVCLHMRDIGLATGTVVAPVHHFGKDMDAGMRGASAWRGASDHAIAVLGDRNQATGEVKDRKLAVARSRTGEEGLLCCFELPVFTYGVDPYGDPATTCTIKRTDDDPAAKPTAKSKRENVIFFEQAYEAMLKNVSTPSHELKSADGTITLVGVNCLAMRLEFKKLYPSGDEAANKSWSRTLLKMCGEAGEYHHDDGFVYRGKPT